MATFDPLSAGKDVLRTEIAGLEALSKSLDAGFSNVVSVLGAVKGRIIVTGMGKSGHVARKIAATLASTGSPALFVHPAEASHGDLGMIIRDDAILALSKSGETEELRPLLAYAARFSIPVIAVTSGRASTLARAAAASIILPPAAEACGETRAPTTSTTMMMAAGDAIAVALLRARGFTATDFQDFHPGGNLGAALRRVSDLMHKGRELPLCTEGALVETAVAAMSKAGFGCIGVVDGKGALIGILTDGDLRRQFGRDLRSESVGAVMTRNPKTVAPMTLAGEALAALSERKITALFVVDGDRKPVGLLHVHDCLASGVL
jgi:arabinose-5-phosphate isomerase